MKLSRAKKRKKKKNGFKWFQLMKSGIILDKYSIEEPSADLEVQLVQLNHCDGEYSNY